MVCPFKQELFHPMYYLLFGVIYFFSLLPLWILYRVSDLVFFILYYLVGYRRKVVMENLQKSFPLANKKDLESISRRFYRNFCDTWVEMLKILSISKKEIARRISFDYSLLNELYKTGIPVQAFAGHFMNWEFANISVALNQPYPFLGIYMPISSKLISRLVYHLRSRFGTVLIKAGNAKKEMEGWEGKPYMLGLAADQSPSNTLEAYWLEFMNQPSGFIKKPWEKVKTLGHAAVYMKMIRVKRGFYRFEVVPIVKDPSKFSETELVRSYRDLLEADIIKNPDNYLWTHRRWKKSWKKDYRNLWVDREPAPVAE